MSPKQMLAAEPYLFDRRIPVCRRGIQSRQWLDRRVKLNALAFRRGLPNAYSSLSVGVAGMF